MTKIKNDTKFRQQAIPVFKKRIMSSKSKDVARRRLSPGD